MVLAELSWPVQTARLTLRRGRPEDADPIFAYRHREDVGRWLTRIQTDAVAFAVREWPARIPSTVVVEHDGRIIGDTRIVVCNAHAQAESEAAARGQEAELMWAFDPAAHGHGFATEAVRALIEIAFGELAVRRLVAVCYADNTASWRLMERVGMRRESHQIASTLHRDGTWRDFLTYALLAEER